MTDKPLEPTASGLYDPKPQQMITATEYSAIQRAYDFFNAALFEGQLPEVLVTLQRKPKMRGYFWAQQFQGRAGQTTTDELALNPDHFVSRSDEEILSTLVHEMVHVWQQAFGKPSRRAYHNHEWADKMKSLGLHPSDTGAPGGKETGERVSHYIIPDGPFAHACGQLLAQGFRFSWQARPVAAEAKKSTRAKFTCAACGQNAWAKPDAHLLCGICHEENGEISPMEPS
jgi:predicted SprT family Zn-dependent metalloprotease